MHILHFNSVGDNSGNVLPHLIWSSTEILDEQVVSEIEEQLDEYIYLECTLYKHIWRGTSKELS